MDFDFTQLPAEDRYRLLVSFIVPRPIALVTTLSPAGVPNAAPMSFFNVFSQEPPIIILGIQSRPDGTKKDTVVNIEEDGEFVVNMVDLSLSEAMIDCGVSYEPDVDEIATAGLTWVPAQQVRGGRIAESPCAMECKVVETIRYDRRSIILGQVLQMHVRDDCMHENGRHVRPDVYQPIARLHADNYIVSDNQFQLKPPTEPRPGIKASGTV
ncbi:flavin reductase family protein [Parasedimentitalea psychrophila]|uniref:Flavin reductase family protein n=1 Tax=Parasedimentitalea psychrophila TaxID=2997337 RepID=A0A9Y2L196_9RHOB|nr:flavin reductase family protein [Parasedimentitalea psychrophila]WIY25821.1 flavin reductase family protein [Parasedimentitalea psychrophila]